MLNIGVVIEIQTSVHHAPIARIAGRGVALAHSPGAIAAILRQIHRRRGAEALRSLSIRAKSAQSTVRSLSGGNQQKVLFARLLATAPKLLILDEPTRGVDIGAKSEIYRIIDDLAKRGIGVVVISSELPEIIGTCDRVLVMREGQIEGEVGGPGGKPITQENIMALAAGVAA